MEIEKHSDAVDRMLRLYRGDLEADDGADLEGAKHGAKHGADLGSGDLEGDDDSLFDNVGRGSFAEALRSIDIAETASVDDVRAMIGTLNANSSLADLKTVLREIGTIDDPMERNVLTNDAHKAFGARRVAISLVRGVVTSARAEGRDGVRADGRSGGNMCPRLLAALEDYNRRFAVINVQNKVKVAIFQDDGSVPGFVSQSDFVLFTKAEKFSFTDIVNGQPMALCEGIADRWLEWDGRRTLKGLIFRPYGINEPVPEDEGLDTFNLWRGWGVEPVPGNWSLLKGHIFHNICRGNPYWFAWLMCWLADLVQDPDEKKGTAVVLKGKKGTGKSKVGDWVRALMPHNSTSISKADQITGRFNAHQATALLSILEEAFWGGDRSREGALKEMITAPDQLFEPKGVDASMLKSRTRYMLVSNEKWIVPSSEDERRFFALGLSDARMKDAVFFGAIDEQMKNGGLEAMLYDLSRLVRPSWVNLRSPPRTPWLADQISESLDVMHKWFGEVLAEGEMTLPETMAKAAVDQGTERVGFSGEGLSVDELKARVAAQKLRESVPNVVTLPEEGPLVVRRSEAFESFKLFAKQHGGGRYMPTKAKLAAFMEDMGATTVRSREGETRKRVFKFSRTLDECRGDFVARFGGDAGTASDLEPDYSAMVPSTVGGEELERWTAYGCSSCPGAVLP